MLAILGDRQNHSSRRINKSTRRHAWEPKCQRENHEECAGRDQKYTTGSGVQKWGKNEHRDRDRCHPNQVEDPLNFGHFIRGTTTGQISMHHGPQQRRYTRHPNPLRSTNPFWRAKRREWPDRRPFPKDTKQPHPDRTNRRFFQRTRLSKLKRRRPNPWRGTGSDFRSEKIHTHAWQ